MTSDFSELEFWSGNSAVGISELQFQSWIFRVGIPELEFQSWNSADGILLLEFRRWSSAVGILLLEFSCWNSAVGILPLEFRRRNSAVGLLLWEFRSSRCFCYLPGPFRLNLHRFLPDFQSCRDFENFDPQIIAFYIFKMTKFGRVKCRVLVTSGVCKLTPLDIYEANST